MTAAYCFDSAYAARLMQAYNQSGDLALAEQLLAHCRPLVKSLIKYRQADRFIETNELVNLVFVKIWRSIRLFDPARGSSFSFISRVANSVFASAIASAWVYGDRYAQVDVEAFENVFAHNGAEAVADIEARVREIKTAVKEPSELEAQKWLVKSFIDCGFHIRRHQAANAMTEVFGVDYVKSRWIFDHSLVAIRRELIGDRRLNPVNPASLARTRSAGLVRFARFISPPEFAKLVVLTRDVPPNVVYSVNRSNAAGILRGEAEAVRSNVNLILNGGVVGI